jgi:hypothetical protein
VPTPAYFPPLTLPDPEGRPRALAEAWEQGDALVLVGHGDCPTTRRALPYLDRIDRRRPPDRRVVLVLQDEPEAARALVAEEGLSVPVLLEPDPYPLARALGLVAVPTLYLVTRGGAIDASSIGFRRSDLEDLARRLGVASPLFEPDDPAPAFRPG